MRHWTMRQFNARYAELTALRLSVSLGLSTATGSRLVELYRHAAAIDLMFADLYDAATLSDAIGFSSFEMSAYMRATDQRRASAKEWREAANTLAGA